MEKKMEPCYAENIKICNLDQTIKTFTEKDKNENTSEVKSPIYRRIEACDKLKIPSCNIKLHVESDDESQIHMHYEDSDCDELCYYSNNEN